jgi:hypothetical protein
MSIQSLNIPKGYFEVVNLHPPLPKKKSPATKRQKFLTFYFVAQQNKN